MNAPARAIAIEPLLATAKGEPPQAGMGRAFRDDQGEIIEPFNPDHRSQAAIIGVLELDNGTWLARDRGFGIDNPTFPTRELALRCSIARVIKRFRYMRKDHGDGEIWSDGIAGRMIEWALSVKPSREGKPAERPDAGHQSAANPYLITGPALISFSGGRTSGFMLKKILEAHGGTLPADVEVVFANTGKEREETLVFVRECGQRWNVKIYWVEWRDNERGFHVSGFHTASRDGEPFAALIKKKGMPPNWQARFCTQFLKVKAMTAFARSLAWSPGEYAEVIGLRDDEGPRLLKMLARNDEDGRRCIAPLAKAKIAERDVMAFWAAQPFDLGLTPGEGNCDLCFLKGRGLRKQIIRKAPGAATWWIEQEQSVNGFFDRRDSYSGLLEEVKASPDIFETPGADEHDVECGLLCQPEESRADSDAPQPATTSHDSNITDPVVAELVAQHKARKAFPAGHTVHMTLDYTDADNVRSVGTCDCGASFVFAQSHHARMDAAIEAHWQRFDDEPDKTDHRGRPLVAGFACIKGEHCFCQVIDGDHSFAKCVEKRSRCGNWREIETENAATPPAAPEPACAVPEAPRPSVHEGSPIQTAAELDPARTAALEPAQHTAFHPRSESEPARETGFGAGSPLADDDDLHIEWPSYEGFLEQKIVSVPLRGIEVPRDALHPWLKDFCKDITLWALRLGCAGIFAECGLHKTAMQLEWSRQLQKRAGGPTLSVLPLGCRHGFIKEAEQNLDLAVSFIKDAAVLGINAKYIEHPDQMAAGCEHYLTNYEPIRDGKLDPSLFAATSLDEASVLRSYGSKTFQEFLPLFAKVPFKLVATATPAPNRYKELIHYAGFLGVMDTGQALTRFFQRDSSEAGNLTLYPHKEDEFWMWVHSWAAFVTKPSDLGYSDEGYELPPVEVHWHEVPADHTKATPDRDGQGALFRNAAAGLSQAAASRRDSLQARVEKVTEIVAQDPDEHWLFWHDLEAEREALESAVAGIVTITGTGMDLEEREKRLIDFEEGRIARFGTKPILSGLGSNFQYHCHDMIFVGMPGDGYKYELWIQAIKRLQRYGQSVPVKAHMVYSEDQRDGRAALEKKWAQDTAMRARMSAIIRKYGLDTLPLRDALARTIGVKRVEVKGEKFIAVNDDAVTEAKRWPDNSVDLIVTSIPFANHYEYTALYNDFGHTDDNGHFWSQMDFLTAEMMRMLKPGRRFDIHVKDRVLFGSVTGEGVSTISPFHAEAIMHYRAHGFQYMGMHHINTDVAHENAAGSYRLGWSEVCRDGTKIGVGSPEYLLLFRKPQTNRGKGYADVRVAKEKPLCQGPDGPVPFDEKLPPLPGTGYSRARWQIDADAHWRSNGNRFLTPEEFAGMTPQDMRRVFAAISTERIYDYEAHVRIGEELDRRGMLPSGWACLALGATDDWTWHDVNRMRTLNMNQERAGREMHICPLQFDIVDRCINEHSMEGELVYDPFGGLMTVPYRAILKGRRGAATELNADYFLDGVRYCRMAEEKMVTPQLFDLAKFDEANAPPPPSN